MDNGEIQINFLHGIINKKEQNSLGKRDEEICPFFLCFHFREIIIWIYNRLLISVFQMKFLLNCV